MGSAIFACPILDILAKTADYNISAVYSQPPRAAGRGQKLRKTPIHELAERLNIPIETPENFKHDDAYDALKKYHGDIFIVVAYGLILPQKILDLPKYGCVNIHGSLLPRWRGAAPIHRAILSGDEKTGVTMMEMVAQCDAGNIIAQREYALNQYSHLQQCYDDLSHLGADIIHEYLPQYIMAKQQGKNITIPQNKDLVTTAAKIEKQEGFIDFQTMSVIGIDRMVRALNPMPGAFGYINDIKVKIIAGYIADHDNIDISQGYMPCRDGVYSITHIQPANKKMMAFADFNRGYLQ